MTCSKSNFFSIVLSLIVLVSFILFFYNIKENFSLENIYNEPLESCKEGSMSNGSWDNEGKCSETDGGVHQICINNISSSVPDFSLNTGQSDWSNRRNRDNHCVCLGAWSLLTNKINNNLVDTSIQNNTLKCEAIPNNALTEKYLNRFMGWNRWNNLERNNQIIDGVEALVDQCYDESQDKSVHLKNNYCKFANKVESLRNRSLYKNLCN